MITALEQRTRGVEVAKIGNPGPLVALYVARRNNVGQLTLPDLSHRLAGNLASTLVVAADWDGSPSGRPVIQTDGSTSYLELPDNLLDGMAKGAISMAFRATSGANARILSDGNGTNSSLKISVANATSIVTFTTDQGGGGVETLQLSTGFLLDEFTTVGVEWGPAGKRIYLKGAALAENVAQAGAAGTSINAPRIGREAATYSSVAFRGIAVFDDNIGARSHRALHDYFWRESI